MPATLSLAISPVKAERATRQSEIPIGTNKKRSPRQSASAMLPPPSPTYRREKLKESKNHKTTSTAATAVATFIINCLQ